ncbi:MAG: winged helix-turn-helix domain-containing protein [Candidatus Woesearchaeota archaeon]
MSKKRDRLQVIHDILNAIRERDGRIKPTHILYKSNLSHVMMDEYLTELMGKGFMVQHTTKDGRTYSLTEKGYEYLNKYKLITEFVESFGLE